MSINDVITVFEDKIGKKVIAYEDKGDSFIVITDASNEYDDIYYKVTKNDIVVTNPILCDLNEDRVIKI